MSPRNHSQYQDLLEKHISGESLAPADRMDLFDHIESCDACRQILEAEERLTARMKTVPRLMAPSELRSKILSQAVRDHRERTTTPIEDPTVSDLFKSGQRTLPTVTADSDDIPVFAGITPPRQSRLRRTWRRASPVMATGFLVITSAGALYMGQFQGIPLAGEAQQIVWSIVNSALGKEKVFKEPETVVVASAVPLPGKVKSKQIASNPAASLIGEFNFSGAKIGGASQTIPGTEELASQIKQARAWFASVDSSIAALARATAEEIPAPAEEAVPQIAALVLKPTDRDGNSGGFRQSELAAALEAIAGSQPGGRIARRDQFAMDGHRYRLYTLDLPAGCMNQMVETLSPYQAPSDGVIVNALASQKQVNVSHNQTVQFFSSNEERLRSALETIMPVSNGGPQERVRVVVVE